MPIHLAQFSDGYAFDANSLLRLRNPEGGFVQTDPLPVADHWQRMSHNEGAHTPREKGNFQSCSILPLWDCDEPLIFALCVAFACGSLSAQKSVWQPSPGHAQMPIWPGAAPDQQPVAGPEFAETSGKSDLVAGRPMVGVSNVTRPTMTIYSPKGKNTGAAIVVFPAGAIRV